MRQATLALCALLLAGCAASGTTTGATRLATDADIDAAEHAPLNAYTKSGHWNEPIAPFRVIGNVYHVGTQGVNAYLIATPKGHVLIDGVVPQSVPQIVDNIRALGFDIADVKYLLNTHAHYDHAGGLAGLQRASGAIFVASAADRATLERGDIGYGPSAGMLFPPIRVDRIIEDGDSVHVGNTTLTAHLTPGHTPGCTSWRLTTNDDDGTPRTKHVLGNVVVDVDESNGSATASCTFTVMQAAPGSPLQPVLAGRYVDRFARSGQAGEWRFTERTVHPELMGDLSTHMGRR